MFKTKQKMINATWDFDDFVIPVVVFCVTNGITNEQLYALRDTQFLWKRLVWSFVESKRVQHAHYDALHAKVRQDKFFFSLGRVPFPSFSAILPDRVDNLKKEYHNPTDQIDRNRRRKSKTE